jgi:phospholipid N-methyltransferase
LCAGAQTLRYDGCYISKRCQHRTSSGFETVLFSSDSDQKNSPAIAAMPYTFFIRMLKDPRTTGALAPSSARLAREMADLARDCDHVLELGAGTGAVTHALSKVVDEEKLQVVELQKKLATSLKKRYPNLIVLHSTAHHALDNYRQPGSVAVVSSLPFRSLPPAIKHLTVQSLLGFLESSPGSQLIQYTYGLGAPFGVPARFKWQQVKWVFANLPPACIWVLTGPADLRPRAPAHRPAAARLS